MNALPKAIKKICHQVSFNLEFVGTEFGIVKPVAVGKGIVPDSDPDGEGF